jgi:hypothetical protein
VKLVIEIKETSRGDVEFNLTSFGGQTATLKERCYAVNIKDLLVIEIPKLGKALGAKGCIGGADPSHS